MSSEKLLHRIEARLQALGLSATAASTQAGLSSDAIRNLRRSVQQGRGNVTLETLQKLAPVLRTTVPWLVNPEDHDIESPHLWEIPTTQLKAVAIAGRVEAGAFHEVDEFNQADQEVILLPPDDMFPNARQMAFIVSGDSMNDLKPRPLFSGDKAVCVAYEDVAHLVPVTKGMVVVVQRTRDSGLFREWSVKQIELFTDRIEFHPRSTNPRHKPIVVARDADSDTGVFVEIIALVRRTVADLPLY